MKVDFWKKKQKKAKGKRQKGKKNKSQSKSEFVDTGFLWC